MAQATAPILDSTISEVVPLDGRAALMHSSCSTNTWTAAMNAGVVRVSIIAMVMLATFGITSAQEAAKLPVAGRSCRTLVTMRTLTALMRDIPLAHWRPERRCGISLPAIVILTN